MTLTEVLTYLRDNKYILSDRGKYVLSKKFQEDVAALKNTVSLLPPASNTLPIIAPKSDEWPQRFMQFIMDAKVPKFLENNRNERYAANKYSEDAMKVFKKAIEGGTDYNLLIKTVQLYYASGNRFKKAVGNYFTQGDWRTDYEALVSTSNDGAAALTNHIKETLDDGQHTPFRF